VDWGAEGRGAEEGAEEQIPLSLLSLTPDPDLVLD